MSPKQRRKVIVKKVWFPAVVTGILLLNALILVIPSCSGPGKRGPQKVEVPDKETLMQHQAVIVDSESENIQNYIERMGYHMEKTGTGLWYQIVKRGEGQDTAATGDQVGINYIVKLLDGTQLYSSDSTGVFEFTVDRSDAASGLHEGIKFMHMGDKAVFIMPSHLAYGLTGDGGKITRYKVLVIETELVSLIKPKGK